MSSSAALQPEPAPITACTVSRDVQNFDLLIEDMEAELGESWGDLGFADALAFLEQPDAALLEFVAIALDEEDETELSRIADLITSAREKEIKVILIAEDVTPAALHQLLRLGASDFLPYPLPEGALSEAIERLRTAPEIPAAAAMPDEGHTPVRPSSTGRDGAVLAVHGLAGGVGATTFAVNLAWELAKGPKKREEPLRVCLLDLDFQFGSTATYLDLPRKDAVYEVLSEAEGMDAEVFSQALQLFDEKLQVFTAPADMLPLDIVTPEDIQLLIDHARDQFDIVIVDMPSALVAWTETVLHASQIYFALLELDMRSAQNALRLVRLLKSEDLPYEKLRFALNRAPRGLDLQAKARAKRLAESLDIDIELMLPDGAKQVTQSGDHGQPLSETAPKNPLRKEIHKLAVSLQDLMTAEASMT